MIQILPQNVIDQIAAGEVVERPAHLIKELVENSLDAGASRIEIEFSEGGRFVKVVDNGLGISKQDLPKALERFATSKISNADDIWRLGTFGFRGEALASISAVSELDLISKTAHETTAFRLKSIFGNRGAVDVVGGSQGTTIIIDKLFENIPARLKFLKSEGAEGSAIKSTIKAIALAHPEVEFQVQEKNKLTFFWPKCSSKKERAEQVLEMDNLFYCEGERDGIKIQAVFASPKEVAKTSKNLWIYVQNRWVQDRGIQAAIMESYRNLLMHGEFPIVTVWVNCPTEFVDVNIHPTKSQVKFQEQARVFKAVHATLRSALEISPWLTKVPFKAEHFSHINEAPTFIEPILTYENLTLGEDKNLYRTQFPQKSFHKEVPTFEKVTIQDIAKLNMSDNETEKSNYWRKFQVLGQSNLTYIICQDHSGLVFVDQHAAHERVLFEKLLSAYQGGQIDVQNFLFPLAIDLSPEKVEALQTVFDKIKALGIELEVLGPSTIGVKAAPPLLRESVLAHTMEKIAQDVIEYGGSFRMERIINDVLATLACHSAIRAGQALSVEEMQNLLVEMDQYPLSSFCPHGRPVSIDYSFTQLEKDFGRIV